MEIVVVEARRYEFFRLHDALDTAMLRGESFVRRMPDAFLAVAPSAFLALVPSTITLILAADCPPWGKCTLKLPDGNNSQTFVLVPEDERSQAGKDPGLTSQRNFNITLGYLYPVRHPRKQH